MNQRTAMIKKVLSFLLFVLFGAVCMFGQQQTGSFSNPVGGDIRASTTNCSGAQTCVWQRLGANSGTTTIALSGTFSATLLVEESNDGGFVWATTATLSAVGTTTYSTNGFSDIRVRCSA